MQWAFIRNISYVESASEAMATSSGTSELFTATGQSSDSEHEPRLPSGSGSSADCPSTEVVKTKIVKPSDFGRKRKVASYPPTGRRQSHGFTGKEPKNIHPSQRVKEFASETLKVHNKKLFCEACREELSLKSSVLRNHFQSRKHVEGKKRLEKKEAREKDIAEALEGYNTANHLRGETRQKNPQVFRIKVVTCFLRAGVPLSKLACFLELLEENAFRVSDRRHMSDLIPFIVQEEQALIKKGKCVSVIYLMVPHEWERHLL